jgi:hypothetical protein
LVPIVSQYFCNRPWIFQCINVSGDINSEIITNTTNITTDTLNSRVITYGLSNTNLETDLTNMKATDTTQNNRLTTLETQCSGISYSNTSNVDLIIIDNNVSIRQGKVLTIGSTDVPASTNTINTNLATLNTITSGFSYASGSDTTTVENNVTLSSGKKFYT